MEANEQLNHRPRQKRSSLRNHRYPIANVIILAVAIEIAGLATNNHPIADANILVDDAMLHRHIATNAQRHQIGTRLVRVDQFRILFIIIIRTHHDDFFQTRTRSDNTPNADDRV